jgi:DNA repair protein RadC
VREHDDPAESRGTAPYSRPLSPDVAKTLKQNQLGSSNGLVVHNHPSGDPTPSRADIQMTQQIIDVAKPLGISVHDHIIVGKEGHASLKGLRLI